MHDLAQLVLKKNWLTNFFVIAIFEAWVRPEKLLKSQWFFITIILSVWELGKKLFIINRLVFLYLIGNLRVYTFILFPEIFHPYTCDLTLTWLTKGTIAFFSYAMLISSMLEIVILVGISSIIVDVIFTQYLHTSDYSKYVVSIDEHFKISKGTTDQREVFLLVTINTWNIDVSKVVVPPRLFFIIKFIW